MEELESLYMAGGMQNRTAVVENSYHFLKMLNSYLVYDPAMPLLVLYIFLGIYQREMKT